MGELFDDEIRGRTLSRIYGWLSEEDAKALTEDVLETIAPLIAAKVAASLVERLGRADLELTRMAEVAMLAASEPLSGSVMAKAAIASPLATLGSHSRFCSTVPKSEIAPDPRPCIAKAKSASAL